MNTEQLLEERGKTHGDYREHARCTQAILQAVQQERNWEKLPDIIKESIHMVAHKLGRIATGNPYISDHYADIAGYVKLVEKELDEAVGLKSRKDLNYGQPVPNTAQTTTKLYKRPCDGKMVPFNELPEDAQVQVMNEELGPKPAPIKATTPEPYQNPPLVPRRPPEGPGTPEGGGQHARQQEKLILNPDNLSSVIVTEYGVVTLKVGGIYETGGGEKVVLVGANRADLFFLGEIGVGKDTRKVRYNTRGCAGSGAVDDIVKHISTLV